MREINTELITNMVEYLCIKACKTLPPDIVHALENAKQNENWPPARQVLCRLEENLAAAEKTGLPICQDTGMANVFIELGQQVYLTGGGLAQAVDEGVRRGYASGGLRKSVVADPLRRENTKDNTPALLTVEISEGSNVKITVVPKGFGSENMSAIAMLPPAAGRKGAEDFIVETVMKAGANPCPPVVVGVGIGAGFDKAALLAKKALLRPLDEKNADEYYAEMEQTLLEKINSLGIGPAGYGGHTTALGVSVLAAPTHIAGLPVAVNISCHATRRASAVL